MKTSKEITYNIVNNLSLYEEFIEQKTFGKSERTTDAYIVEIRMFLRFVNEFYKNQINEEITTDNIADYCDYFNSRVLNAYRRHLITEYASSSAQKKLSMAKTFVYFLGTEGLIDNSFIKDIEEIAVEEKDIVFLTKEERVMLLNSLSRAKYLNDYSKESRELYRDFVMINLLLSSGLRGFEIRELCLDDINWETNELTFYGKGDKKQKIRKGTLKKSSVRISDDVKKCLLNYINNFRYETDEDYEFKDTVFTTKNKTRMSQNSLSNLIKKRCREAGIPEDRVKLIAPHRLRATYITSLVEKGLHITIIKQLARHKSINATVRYTGMELDLAKDVANELLNDYYNSFNLQKVV